MNKVVLVYPKTGMDVGSTVAPPHNLLCVAAPLNEANYSVRIIDQRVDPDWDRHLGEELMLKPAIVGISCMTGTQVKYAIEAATIARAWPSPIVWGGPHPTLLPEQVLASGLADHVCLGEVDETIVDIVRDIEAKRAPSVIKSPLPDVEQLLPTPWHLIDIEKYIHPDIYLKGGRNLDVGQTSRGCPYQCGFCSSASIRERRWRAMSPEKSVAMIERATRLFKLNGIWLRDDEFYIDLDRALAIAQGITPLGIKWYTSGTRVNVFNKTPDSHLEAYKRSGAHTLKFGAESGNNRILKLMNKGIRREDTIEANRRIAKHDITPTFALMLGFPTETFEEMEDTIELAKQIRRENPRAQFETMAVYTALPGTPMWELAIQYGLKPPLHLEDWTDWNFDEYDPMGRRIPWFDAKERQAIGNLCYLSMLSNAVPNVLDSLNGKGEVLRALYALPHRYFQWRFFGKHYKHTWELGAVRKLRELVFY